MGGIEFGDPSNHVHLDSQQLFLIASAISNAIHGDARGLVVDCTHGRWSLYLVERS